MIQYLPATSSSFGAASPLHRFFLAFAVSCATLAACTGGEEGIAGGEPLDSIPADYAIYGMTAFMTSSGIREGRVVADTAYLFEDSATVNLHGMEVAFYNADGSILGLVTAERGFWDQRTDKMSALGQAVLLRTNDQMRIESEELHYDPEQDRIWSDLPTVQTLAAGSVGRGSSFESDLEFDNVRIINLRTGR